MKIKLSAYYSGGKKDFTPGEIMQTDDVEAARLIELGAAVAVDEPDDEAPRGKKN